jgi:hypothetical protein
MHGVMTSANRHSPNMVQWGSRLRFAKVMQDGAGCLQADSQIRAPERIKRLDMELVQQRPHALAPIERNGWSFAHTRSLDLIKPSGRVMVQSSRE